MTSKAIPRMKSISDSGPGIRSRRVATVGLGGERGDAVEPEVMERKTRTQARALLTRKRMLW